MFNEFGVRKAPIVSTPRLLSAISLREKSLLKSLIGEVRKILRCYLVRHGEAVSAALDPQRPLSAHGRAQVAELGQLALSRNVTVAEVLHSGILRARQTAEILAGYLQPPGGLRLSVGLLPEDDPECVKIELEAAVEPILLVGHLPFMDRLASLLLRGDRGLSKAEFSPATMVSCAKIEAMWRIEWQIGPTAR